MQGAWPGIWSQVSRIRPWAEGGAKPLSYPGIPYLFIYERERERERERDRQRHRQREKQDPCREPDAGLNLRSPGSGPGPKAALNRWATQGCPDSSFFLKAELYSYIYIYMRYIYIWDIYIYIYISHNFVHSSTVGHWGFFHAPAIVNNATMKGSADISSR